jgi:RNA polymerase-interacting CarD/CdnL/TRCF family regulator
MAKYAVGDRVTQPQYGAGTITAVDESRTVIEFDEHGTRMFATSIVSLERSATPAPVRASRGRKKAAAAKPS